jgi:hypothetical protein
MKTHTTLKIHMKSCRCLLLQLLLLLPLAVATMVCYLPLLLIACVCLYASTDCLSDAYTGKQK